MNVSASAPSSDVLAAFFEAHGRGKGIAFLASMAACSVVGVIGNGVTLSVLVTRLRSASTSRFAFRTHYNHFTSALAASDLFVCAVWMPYEALVIMRVIVDEALCKAMGFLSNVAIIFAAMTHFGICVERYYAVRKPMSPVSAGQMKLVTGGMAALSAAMSVPALFAYSIYSYQSAESAEAGCHYQYDSDVGLYYNISLGAVLSASIVAMLCMYSAVFHVILKRMLQRRKGRGRAAEIVQLEATSSSTEPNNECSQPKTEPEAKNSGDAAVRLTTIAAASRVAFMFFFVTLVFYASWVPFFLCALDVIERDIITESSHFVNSCTNFVLYSIFNAELRREMIQKIACTRRQKRIVL